MEEQRNSDKFKNQFNQLDFNNVKKYYKLNKFLLIWNILSFLLSILFFVLFFVFNGLWDGALGDPNLERTYWLLMVGFLAFLILLSIAYTIVSLVWSIKTIILKTNDDSLKNLLIIIGVLSIIFTFIFPIINWIFMIVLHSKLKGYIYEEELRLNSSDNSNV